LFDTVQEPALPSKGLSLGEAPARDYRCCLLNERGRIEATFVVCLHSDDAAREFAGELLHKSNCILAEVWRGSDMVFLTGRAD
jgi:hypothetical protein